MVVVADTTPINYLLLIGEIRLLPALYGNVIVPLAVGSELRDPDAPEIVRRWMARPRRGSKKEIPSDRLVRRFPIWMQAKLKRLNSLWSSQPTSF
jgi:hypothetical protein